MKNLSEELKNLFKEMYPEGYKEYIQKTIKPNGEPIFSVPMETEDTMYMVKVEMKIDTLIGDDDLDKDLYGDDKVEDSEFAPISEALEKDEENNSHTERVIKHGDAFEEFLMEEEQSKNKKKQKSKKKDDDDDDVDFDDIDEKDDYDSFDEPEDDIEPSAEDLMDMDDYIEDLKADNPMDIHSSNKSSNKKKATKETKETPKATKTTKTTKETHKNINQKTELIR